MYRPVWFSGWLFRTLDELNCNAGQRKQVIFAAGDVVSCLPVCYSELVPGISPTDNTDEGYDMRHTADHQPEAGHVVRRRRRSTARTSRDGAQNGRLGILFTKSGFRVDRTGAEPEDAYEANLKKRMLEDPYGTLYAIGFEERGSARREAAPLAYLRRVAEEFIRTLTDIPELEIAREDVEVSPSEAAIEDLLLAVPFGIGTEYIDPQWIRRIFDRLREVYAREIREYAGTVQLYLTEKSQQLRVPERIFFHLVENRKDEDGFPFAFLATYATRDENNIVRHMPLSYALEEYKHERQKLVTLLTCLNGAAEVSALVAGFMESGEMFHPLRLTAAEAYAFLKDVKAIEEAGILCRVPNWWKRGSAQISMDVKLGEKKPSLLGFDALVSMQPELTANGTALTAAEIRKLLAQTEGLAFLKGKWVVVDHARLEQLLEQMEKYEGSLTLLEALRMEAGIGENEDIDIGPKITNGKWLGTLFQKLRQPAGLRSRRVPATVNAELRPYQKTGYNWLMYMQDIGFGACLADDMGLGKTLQVLAWLDRLRKKQPEARVLLIVPASLLGNWQREAARFTPGIELQVLHGMTGAAMNELAKNPAFLNITTYGMVNRLTALQDREWTAVILDEAQAIKNPGTRQTRAIKKLRAQQRVAMTGTPIENDLTNLWSLFDFLNKGLLGTSDEFRDFARHLEESPEGYQKLKNMVAPFILRRVKTDKSIIADLPDKMETVDYTALSKKQIVLYRRQVKELEEAIERVQGIQRRGVILAAITKLKQICNHPDQFLGQSAYDPEESGKFAMLREICETIYEKRERVLVFTQYREITEYLARYLEQIFHAKGLVLHGGTRVKRRQEMVEEFNGEDYVPFMVLSVKAGGTGLNLTGANHVIHFDRWWNPAVENQATDRAFRIGQTKDVIVHKLVCTGTIEERIDTLINSKKELAENVIGAGGENWITELGDREILDLMRLEI